jgi:hypothetical protein
VLAFQKNDATRAMCFELFEIDGNRWLCKNNVGKKKKNLFFTLWPLWYGETILLAEI